jgi:hypothetical protein
MGIRVHSKTINFVSKTYVLILKEIINYKEI